MSLGPLTAAAAGILPVMLIAFLATLVALFAGPAAVMFLTLRAPIGRETEDGFEPAPRRSAMLPGS